MEMEAKAPPESETAETKCLTLQPHLGKRNETLFPGDNFSHFGILFPVEGKVINTWAAGYVYYCTKQHSVLT